MKKKIISALLALSVGFGAMPAFAAENETAVWYNGQTMTIAQEPIIIGETQHGLFSANLLPLRALGEAIGAEIGFDAATEKITVDYNGRIAEFDMRGTEASVVENGEHTETIYLEHMLNTDGKHYMLRPTIRNNRMYLDTYVLMDMFDIQIGWDDAEQTIYAVDVAKYVKDLFANAPALEKYLTVFGNTPKTYTSTAEMAIRFDMEYADTELGMQAVNVEVTLEENDRVTEEAMESAIVVDLPKINLPESAGADAVDFSKLRDLKINVIDGKNGVYYFQTDLIEKLAAAMPEVAELQTAARVIKADTWLQADLRELGMDELWSAQTTYTAEEIMQVLEESLTVLESTVYSLESAKVVDAIFAMYETMFSEPYFTVTGTEADGYQMVMDVNKKSLIDLTMGLAEVLGEEVDMAEVEKEMPDPFTIHLVATIAPDQTMKTEMKMEIAFGTEEKVQLDMTVNGTLTPGADGEDIVIPTVFLDLLQIGELLSTQM